MSYRYGNRDQRNLFPNMIEDSIKLDVENEKKASLVKMEEELTDKNKF